MTKSAKIREYFKVHPDADVEKVANRFDSPKSMVYKLRKEVAEQWSAPKLVPVPPVSVWKDAPSATAPAAEVDGIVATLTERGERYGKFIMHATIAQSIKNAIFRPMSERKIESLSADQIEAMEMIAHKLARIVNGDHNYADSWVDIAGYAKLVADRLQGVTR